MMATLRLIAVRSPTAPNLALQGKASVRCVPLAEHPPYRDRQNLG